MMNEETQRDYEDEKSLSDKELGALLLEKKSDDGYWKIEYKPAINVREGESINDAIRRVAIDGVSVTTIRAFFPRIKRKVRFYHLTRENKPAICWCEIHDKVWREGEANGECDLCYLLSAGVENIIVKPQYGTEAV